MPVELTERQVRDALSVVGEWDHEAAQSARAAFEWMGWDGERSLLLRRYDVHRFAWYILPRKFLAPLERKRQTAAALAGALERLGGRAASYADVCRSPATDDLLLAWEAEEPDAWRRFKELLDDTGIEPPDTDLLAWGSVMGLEEARVREQVATALEVAIEDGRLEPGTPGFQRRQAEVANAVLQEPDDDSSARSRLEAVHAERLGRWVEHGHVRGSAERRAIVEPVVAAISAPPPVLDPDAAQRSVAPALWLLERANEEIALTQTGALNRALVREAAERWPGWWHAELFGPPNREDDLTPLSELHELLRALRLVRRKGRRLTATVRGRKLQADPPALLEALATALLAGGSFRTSCAELAAAVLLSGVPVDYSDALAQRIEPAIAAEEWRAGDDSPDVRDIAWALAEFLRPAEAIGVLERRNGASRTSREPLVVSDAGRAALIVSLRARALAPVRGPY